MHRLFTILKKEIIVMKENVSYVLMDKDCNK